jgi:hypothetical protein
MQFPPKRRGMHHYWHNPRSTDVSVMRTDAERRLVDTHHPEESIIHYHDSGQPCDVYKHELYSHPLEETK